MGRRRDTGAAVPFPPHWTQEYTAKDLVQNMGVFKKNEYRIVQYGEILDKPTFDDYDAALDFAKKHDAYVMNRNGLIVGH